MARTRFIAALLAVLGLGAGLVVAPAPTSAATTTVGPRGVIYVDGVPTFPIALLKPPPLDSVTPWGTNGIDEVVKGGVNLLGAGPQGRPWQEGDLEDAHEWNAAAAARGVHTWVHLRELARAAPESPEDERLREVVTALKDDPGLAMWKSVDEPWWSGYPWETLLHSYLTLRELDPAHPSLVIQAPRGTIADLAPYNAVSDIHSVDVYPVRYDRLDPPLGAVGNWTRLLQSATPHRGVLTTLAICSSGSRDRGGSGAVLLATREQKRFMIYDAIMNGARGLILFGGQYEWCHDEAEMPHGWKWSYWQTVLRPLLAEIGPRSRLYPALLSPGTVVRVRSSHPKTRVMSRQVGRETWVFVAHRGRATVDVTISGLPKKIRRGWVYREGRTVRVRNGAFTEKFSRWDVHVYRFLR